MVNLQPLGYEKIFNSIKIEGDNVFLMPENSNYKPIQIAAENDLIIWGIVTYVIKKV